MSSGSVSIDDLERAVFARQHEQAGAMVLRILEGIVNNRGAFVRNDGSTRVSFDEELRQLTRIAGAMVALLADPAMRISQAGYERLASLNQSVGDVFALSGYRSAEHLWRLVASTDARGQLSFTEDALRKGFAFSTVSSLPVELAVGLRGLPKAIAVPALLGLLSQNLVLSDHASRVRTELLKLGDLLDGHLLSDTLANTINAPYMLCSYAEDAGKHDIKKNINRAVRAWLEFKGAVPAPREAAPRAGKPRMLVMMEYANLGHAMLRCYGHALRAMRERFHTICASAPQMTEQRVVDMFDEHLPLQIDRIDPADLLRRIAEARPDVVYFPSLGMTPWSIWASNVRFAPLQVMSLGHPATSHSPHIDFVLATTGIHFDPARFSEKLVLTEGPGTPFDLLPGATEQPLQIRVQPEVLRIAVPAKLFKLSSGLLKACRRIAERAPRPVEFHFFPNESGVLYHVARQRVEEAMPEFRTVTYPAVRYEAYLRNLDQCDIALGGFNFGNTNGAVDALLRCIPIVALDGPEMHQGTEQLLMRPLGLPEWLIARSEEEYVEAALRLVGDDAERVALSRSLEGKMEELLEKERGRTMEFADAVWWMYQNREELLSREEQVLNFPRSG